MTIEVKINMTRILTLSEEASKILEFKTSQSGMATTSDMLEWIIKFFGKTSNEDKQKWKEKKDNARKITRLLFKLLHDVVAVRPHDCIRSPA